MSNLISGAEMKRKKMLVLCPYPQGVAAGQRLKYEQYFDSWKAHGFDIEVSSFMDMALWNVVYKKGHYTSKIIGVLRGHLRRTRDFLRLTNYDIVYVSNWVTPFGTSLFERLTCSQSKALTLANIANCDVCRCMPCSSQCAKYVCLSTGAHTA